jgi:hypothetical protein
MRKDLHQTDLPLQHLAPQILLLVYFLIPEE